MPQLHQIYCTLLNRSAESGAAESPLGFGVRGSSLPRDAAQALFTNLEPFLYFHLPNDLPGAVARGLTPATAPRRMLYLPQYEGATFCGQLSFRPREGNLGTSYFAHLLVDESHTELTAADALRLWGAPPWIDADNPDAPFELPQVAGVKAWLRRRPAIDEAVFFSFLTTSPGGDFDDPRGVITERWRNTPVVKRQTLVRDVFEAFLDLDLERREAVLLVIEPETAPLLFFGLLRLLPRVGPWTKVSVSTLEAFTNRPLTNLAATTFHDPATFHYPIDGFNVKGSVFNTFHDERTPPPKRERQPIYPRAMLGRLIAQGWDDVDRLLRSMQRLTSGTIAECEQVLAADKLVAGILQPADATAAPALPKSKLGKAHVKQGLAEQLAAWGPADPRVAALAASRAAAGFVWRTLGTTDKLGACEPALDAILKASSADALQDLFQAPELTNANKLRVLAACVAQHGRLADADNVWKRRKPAEGQPADPAWIEALCRRLDADALTLLVNHTLETLPADDKAQAARGKRMTSALLAACEQDPTRRPALDRWLTHPRFPSAWLADALRDPATAPKVAAHFAGLPPLLKRWVVELPEKPAEFESRLALLTGLVASVPPDVQPRLMAWQAICEVLQKFRGADHNDAQVVDAFGERLIVETGLALPAAQYPADRNAAQRTEIVSHVLQTLAPEVQWPEDFFDRLRTGLCGLGWMSEEPAADGSAAPRIKATPGRRKSPTTLVIALAASVALVFLCLLTGFVAYLASNQNQTASRVPVYPAPIPRTAEGTGDGPAAPPGDQPPQFGPGPGQPGLPWNDAPKATGSGGGFQGRSFVEDPGENSPRPVATPIRPSQSVLPRGFDVLTFDTPDWGDVRVAETAALIPDPPTPSETQGGATFLAVDSNSARLRFWGLARINAILQRRFDKVGFNPPPLYQVVLAQNASRRHTLLFARTSIRSDVQLCELDLDGASGLRFAWSDAQIDEPPQLADVRELILSGVIEVLSSGPGPSQLLALAPADEHPPLRLGQPSTDLPAVATSGLVSEQDLVFGPAAVRPSAASVPVEEASLDVYGRREFTDANVEALFQLRSSRVRIDAGQITISGVSIPGLTLQKRPTRQIQEDFLKQQELERLVLSLAVVAPGANAETRQEHYAYGTLKEYKLRKKISVRAKFPAREKEELRAWATDRIAALRREVSGRDFGVEAYFVGTICRVVTGEFNGLKYKRALLAPTFNFRPEP